MVINCPECSTKFRVSTEKIPVQGAKLRCARCRHIFFVTREEEPSVSPTTESPKPFSSVEESSPAPEPPPESPSFDSPQESAFSAEKSPAESDFAFGDNSSGADDPFGDTDFGFDETPAATEEPAASDSFGVEESSTEAGGPSDHIDFGFEEATPAPKPAPKDDSSDAFGFDAPERDDSPEIGAGTNDEFDASAFEEEAPASDDTFAFDEDYGNLEMGGDEDDQAFSFGEETDSSASDFAMEQSEPQDEISTEEAAAGFAEQSSSPENFQEEFPTETYEPTEGDNYSEQGPTESAPISKKRGPFATLILFLLVLILGIVVAGGVLYWQSGPEALQQIYQRLTGQEVSVPVKGQIVVKGLQGSFISNKSAGELLVIQGNAINEFRESRAAIQVKGILFDKQGNQLRQKTIFCGNPISAEDLRSLPYDKLEEIMGNQFGESLVNLNVTPGQVIPFTIIFRDIPEDLSEFVVEVADSNPAAQ